MGKITISTRIDPEIETYKKLQTLRQSKGTVHDGILFLTTKWGEMGTNWDSLPVVSVKM